MFTSLQQKAQPKIDAARYKAEAGLSRRGLRKGRVAGAGGDAGEKEDGGVVDRDYGHGGLVI